MESMDDLLSQYNKALDKARAKLGSIQQFKKDRIQIPIILESSIIKKIQDLEHSKNCMVSPSMFVFTFLKNTDDSWDLIS